VTATERSLPRRVAASIVRKPSWRHNLGLVGVLASKNIKLRYKRTSLGIAWAIAQPLVQATVLTVVFSRVFGTAGVEHFGLYVLSGVMPFSATSSGFQSATVSVVENAGLLKKVALPRLIFPVSAVIGGLVPFGAALAVLLAITTLEGALSIDVLLLVPGVLLVVTLATSAGILGAALYVRMRDIRFLIESGMLLLFYASAVFYVPERLGGLADWLRLNPMMGVLTVFRAAVTDRPIDWTALTYTLGLTVILLAVGLTVFRRRADDFADLV